MALRIGPSKPPVEEPVEEETPVEEAVEVIEEMPVAEDVMPLEDPGMAAGGSVDPMSARYFDSTHSCAGCIHFMEPGSCEIVAGPIDPGGICSIYTPDVQDAVGIQEDIVSEEVPV